jgi:hypothetical protein
MGVKPGSPETPLVLGLLGLSVIFWGDEAVLKNICEVCIC